MQMKWMQKNSKKTVKIQQKTAKTNLCRYLSKCEKGRQQTTLHVRTSIGECSQKRIGKSMNISSYVIEVALITTITDLLVIAKHESYRKSLTTRPVTVLYILIIAYHHVYRQLSLIVTHLNLFIVDKLFIDHFYSVIFNYSL